MPTKIVMPSMGATMEQGTVIAWRVSEGDWVNAGSVLCELETDKSTFDFESPAQGTVLKLIAKAGQNVPVGELMAIIGDPGENILSDWLTEPPVKIAADETKSVPVPVSIAAQTPDSDRIRISPKAKKLAAELGLDYSSIKGSGPGGRIESVDIENFAKAAPSQSIPVTNADSDLLNIFKFDLEKRDERIRETVLTVHAELPKPDLSENIVATYFIWAHNLTPAQVGKEICYHMTSGVRKAPPGSLLDQCTGKVLDSVCFDKEERLGIVRVAFPLKMLRDADGKVYSTDILHIAAGAGIFALRENRDAMLCDIAMSDEVLATFPGPAYGAPGLRTLTNLGDNVAFGTILKPCTGITPHEEAEIIYEAASNPLFMFIKEDENFLPHVPFAPVKTRAQHAIKAIERAKSKRGDRGLVFANHVTAPPHLLMDYVKAVLDLGVNGLMFSEYYVGGAVRMVRELTKNMKNPPVIYGHNGGIDSMTHCVWREVLDFFARLDGIDFRQTAPYTHGGMSLLRPYGPEWRNVEHVLTKPLAGRAPVMIARAGGLDQGNLIANFIDIKNNNCDLKNYLFLAGSAINGIKNDSGQYDPKIGAEAMQQTIAIYNEGIFTRIEEATVANLKTAAQKRNYASLLRALAQRYTS